MNLHQVSVHPQDMLHCSAWKLVRRQEEGPRLGHSALQHDLPEPRAAKAEGFTVTKKDQEN